MKYLKYIRPYTKLKIINHMPLGKFKLAKNILLMKVNVDFLRKFKNRFDKEEVNQIRVFDSSDKDLTIATISKLKELMNKIEKNILKFQNIVKDKSDLLFLL